MPPWMGAAVAAGIRLDGGDHEPVVVLSRIWSRPIHEAADQVNSWVLSADDRRRHRRIVHHPYRSARPGARTERIRVTKRLAVPRAPRPYWSCSSNPTELCTTWLRTA